MPLPSLLRRFANLCRAVETVTAHQGFDFLDRDGRAVLPRSCSQTDAASRASAMTTMATSTYVVADSVARRYMRLAKPSGNRLRDQFVVLEERFVRSSSVGISALKQRLSSSVTMAHLGMVDNVHYAICEVLH